MKGYVSIFALVFLWCAVMPVLINAKDGQAYYEEQSGGESCGGLSSGDAAYERPQIKVRVCDAATGEKREYELEEYVALALGAVTDEGQPAEALKAQAVAIRSVVCFRHESPEHEGFELCTDGKHCFALAEAVRDDCLSAVSETCGLILTYNGKAAFAVSHLSSAVTTESGSAVYGGDYPYLAPVKVRDESVFAAFKTEKFVTDDEYKKAFAAYGTSFTDDNMLGAVKYTESGRVYTVEAGGLCFKGSTFAGLFGLPSACFTVKRTDGGFAITCRGSGNGVGLSRLSALIMANEGQGFEEILSYFYGGTQLSRISAE